MGEQCGHSGAFPTNYDGEVTQCPDCGRKLKLDRGGRVPRHNTTPSRQPKLLPRGEAWIDGRRTGGAYNPGPAQ